MSDGPQNPRAWLLTRHTLATPKLDALRHASLPAPSLLWRDVLHGLFFPQRHLWGALVAVWLGLLAFHLALGGPPRSNVAHPLPPEAVAAWLAQIKSHDFFTQLDHHR